MFKKLVLVSSVLLAAGCGGGGDSGDGRIGVTASAGEGGTISPASQRVVKGSQATLTVQADAIYTLQSVTGCGGTLEGNTYRTSAVNSDCAVIANFALKPLVINVETLPQSAAENSSTSINIVAENAKNSPIITLKAVGGYGNSFVTIEQISDTLFNLVTQNVDREAIVELEVTAQDGNNTSRVTTQRFSLVIENTSFAAALARYQVIVDNTTRILALTEEKLVSSAFRHSAAILAIKANKVPEGTVAGINNTTYAELESQLNQIPVASYLAGNISDAELTTEMNSIESLMAAHVAPYITNINQFMPAIAAQGVSAVFPQHWHINAELNTISLFVGNAELGQVNNGEWVFTQGFEYLGVLINSDCSL